MLRSLALAKSRYYFVCAMKIVKGHWIINFYGSSKSHQKATDIFSWPINLSILIGFHGPWIQRPHEKTMNHNTMKFMAFSMPLKGHEKQPNSFKVFLWIFHGFAQNVRVFMAHENWKIKGFLMTFWMFFFFMLFPGWHAMKNLIRFPMKIPLKSFENPVKLS